MGSIVAVLLAVTLSVGWTDAYAKWIASAAPSPVRCCPTDSCRHAAGIRSASCTAKASTQTLTVGGPKIQEVFASGDPERNIPPPPP